MMAIMLVACAAAFAGDSPALKAIMKVKTYEEAEQLLKTTFDQLANDEEKAKAYNKLVDLAMVIVNKESAAITENQANAQLGIDKRKDVDTLAMCDALIKAIAAAVECNKYDQLPNAKGKVAPKFAEKNAQRIWVNRNALLTIGDDFRQKDDMVKSLKYWTPYLDSYTEPLFAAQNHEPEKDVIEQVAYLCSWMALKLERKDDAIRFAKMALQGTKFKTEAESILLQAMSSGLKNRQDSLAYVSKLKAMYAEEPENEFVINALYNIYGDLKDMQSQKELLEGILARDPNNFIALADMGIMYISQNDYAAAVPYLRKAVQVRDNNVNVFFYLGTSLCMLAQDEKTTDAQKKAYYKEAIQVFDKCKELDPDKQQINWGYNRQNAYYNYYGPDSPEFKQAEADYRN